MQEGGGADNSNGVNFEHHRKLLSLWSFAESFRRSDLNSDFTEIIHHFIHVYRAGQFWAREDNLMGSILSNKWGFYYSGHLLMYQKNSFELWVYNYGFFFIIQYMQEGCKFQKDWFKPWFYIDFFMILCVYIALGQGQITSDDKFLLLI